MIILLGRYIIKVSHFNWEKSFLINYKWVCVSRYWIFTHMRPIIGHWCNQFSCPFCRLTAVSSFSQFWFFSHNIWCFQLNLLLICRRMCRVIHIPARKMIGRSLPWKSQWNHLIRVLPILLWITSILIWDILFSKSCDWNFIHSNVITTS